MLAVKVDISKLYTLAERMEGLKKDIYSLSDNVTSASNSVLSRTNRCGYTPLITAYTKALNSTKQAKDLSTKICNNLSRQTEMLRSAAYSYRANDKIDRVN